jgi:cytochrome c oxidase cbb3-type subunit 3
MESNFYIDFAGYIQDPLVWFFALMSLVLLIVLCALSQSLIILTRQLHGGEAPTVPTPARRKEKKNSTWGGLMKSLTRAVPVEQEKDVMLDHNYDGIRELDNQLPPWWKWGFYITIVFAVVYLAYYHMASDGNIMQNEYIAEIKAAEHQKAEQMKLASENITEVNVVALNDAQHLSEGKLIYDNFCMPCHGVAGQGTVGPNLTDEFWIHGGGIKNVFKTINYGVPAKGMIAWKAQLPPKKIQEVASYILSMKGTNPPGAKEPQGEIWTESLASDSLNKMVRRR